MALDLSWQQHLYCPPPPAALIGSGRKGRRKGSKNRSFVQRIDERDEKNEIKRQNERQRVKNISYQYNRLRRALGDPHPEKKLRKQQVLDACINYIQHLQRILKTADGGGGSVCYSSDSESTSCANTSSEDVTSFSFPACFTTNGGKDIVQVCVSHKETLVIVYAAYITALYILISHQSRLTTSLLVLYVLLCRTLAQLL